MSEKKYHFIYKTTNILTGRYYFGMHSTNSLEDDYLGSGKRLRYSIRKYGEENHKREIIEFCKNRKELIKREKEIVNLNEVAKKDCMNIMIGGMGGLISEKQQKYRSSCGGKARAERLKKDKNFREKISIIHSRITKRAHDTGKHDHIKQTWWIGKKHKEESKKLIGEKNSVHQKGSGNSQYGTCWIYKNKENKKIKKKELDLYLKNDWIKGRKIKF